MISKLFSKFLAFQLFSQGKVFFISRSCCKLVTFLNSNGCETKKLLANPDFRAYGNPYDFRAYGLRFYFYFSCYHTENY